jgi:hypothetical protein
MERDSNDKSTESVTKLMIGVIQLPLVSPRSNDKKQNSSKRSASVPSKRWFKIVEEEEEEEQALSLSAPSLKQSHVRAPCRGTISSCFAAVVAASSISLLRQQFSAGPAVASRTEPSARVSVQGLDGKHSSLPRKSATAGLLQGSLPQQDPVLSSPGKGRPSTPVLSSLSPRSGSDTRSDFSPAVIPIAPKLATKGGSESVGTGAFLGGKYAVEKVIAYGGISEANGPGLRSSERIQAQPNADMPQMERAKQQGRVWYPAWWLVGSYE